MNKPKNSETIFVRDLNANDLFVVPGHSTIYVCVSRQTIGISTRVEYRVAGDGYPSEFVKPNLSTIYLIKD